MYKVCPACSQTSYSAAASRIWFCPCCGEDISAACLIADGRSILSLAARQKTRRNANIKLSPGVKTAK